MKKQLYLSCLLILIQFTVQAQYWETLSIQKSQEGNATFKRRIDYNDFKINPDGSKFYKTEFLLETGHRKEILQKAHYCTDRLDGWGTPTLLIRNGFKYIYILEHAFAYGMNAIIYTSYGREPFHAESIFSSANMGWYPRIFSEDNGNVNVFHFNFNGYYSMRSVFRNGHWTTTQSGKMQPKDAEKAYKREFELNELDPEALKQIRASEKKGNAQ